MSKQVYEDPCCYSCQHCKHCNVCKYCSKSHDQCATYAPRSESKRLKLYAMSTEVTLVVLAESETQAKKLAKSSTLQEAGHTGVKVGMIWRVDNKQDLPENWSEKSVPWSRLSEDHPLADRDIGDWLPKPNKSKTKLKSSSRKKKSHKKKVRR